MCEGYLTSEASRHATETRIYVYKENLCQCQCLESNSTGLASQEPMRSSQKRTNKLGVGISNANPMREPQNAKNAKLKCAGSKIISGKNREAKPNSIGILLVEQEMQPTKFSRYSCNRNSYLKIGPEEISRWPGPPRDAEAVSFTGGLRPCAPWKRAGSCPFCKGKA